MTTGFLGTRADALVDLTVVFFLAAPFLMLYAVRLAARDRLRAHRNLQAGLVVAGVVAVLILELSIRYGGAMAAYSQSSYYGSPLLTRLFYVHLAVAIPTFIGWCVLAGASWRRFSRVLPGRFSRMHRRWGQTVYLGLCLTCVTGVVLYVMAYGL